MDLFECLANATFEDLKVGLVVISLFMTMQVMSSVGRYYFGVTVNPFDLVARLFSPKCCPECHERIQDCTCFSHLKNYTGYEGPYDD